MDNENYSNAFKVNEQLFLIIDHDEDEAPIVDMEDLLQAFDNITEIVENNFINTEDDIKLIVADVEVVSINENNVELNLILLGGTYSPYSCEVQSEDYWYAFDELGRCGAYSGTLEALDAMQRLDIMANCAEPYCTGTSYTYSVETIEIPGALVTTAEDECISPYFMDDYLTDNLDNIVNYTPTEKVFIICDSYEDIIPGTPTYYAQMMVVTYGKTVCIGGGGGK